MKKMLLGTTALVSAGMVAGQTSAAEPIELSLGGYHNWAAYYADIDDNPATATLPAQPGFGKGNHDIKFDGELHVRGKTVLDNGLEVGVRIEIEGEETSDQLDENYAYISGSFGEFRVGNDDPASYIMATAAPYINYVFGANSPSVFANGLSQFFALGAPDAMGNPDPDAKGLLMSRFAAGGQATFATFPNQTSDDARVMYFSPVFNGFQFGLSYAPENGEATPGDVYALPGKGEETYSVGARYDGDLGDVGLTVAGGYLAAAKADGAADDRDSASWNAGAVIYFGNWGFGGSYLNTSDNMNIDGTDIRAYDVGLSYYADGPWSAGVYWLHSETDYAKGMLLMDEAVSDQFDAYRLLGQYDMGPGIAVTGALGFDRFEDGAFDTDYDTFFGGAGLLISF